MKAPRGQGGGSRAASMSIAGSNISAGKAALLDSEGKPQACLRIVQRRQECQLGTRNGCHSLALEIEELIPIGIIITRSVPLAEEADH